MKHLYWTLLTLWLLHMPTFGQINPHTVLHDALVLENGGSFEAAARVAKAAIDSRQLSGNELEGGTLFLQLLAKEREIWRTRKSLLSMHCEFSAMIASTLRTMRRPWKTTPDSIANWDNLTLLRRCGERLFTCAKGLGTIRELR